LEVSQLAANTEVAARLKLKPGSPVYRIRRLRYNDGFPATLETTHLPEILFPGLETQGLETSSLHS
jgi:DNA-binding GntR family transcriptional regulator